MMNEETFQNVSAAGLVVIVSVVSYGCFGLGLYVASYGATEFTPFLSKLDMILSGLKLGSFTLPYYYLFTFPVGSILAAITRRKKGDRYSKLFKDLFLITLFSILFYTIYRISFGLLFY